MNKDSSKGNRPNTRERSRNLPGDLLDELVTGAKNGDVESFQKLYNFYGQKILNYIYRMTGSRAEAEDLTQDTFIQAYKNLDSLKENRKFQSWLFRIAQNNVYQKYRGKKPQMESIDQEESTELSDLQKLATPMKSPEENILSEELESMIQHVIDDLPEKYKTVFLLSAIHKLSYQEISEMVGRSLASVKSDIHRARVEVRDRIKEYLGENYGMSKLH